MIAVDLAVVGAGPAGMAAAAAAARFGATVALIDDHGKPGGKVLAPGTGRLPATLVERHEQRIAANLRAGLDRPGILRLFGRQVWHVQEGRLLHLAPVGRSAAAAETVQCRRLILAAGAVERIVPFPGWTLPGVFTLGGLNGWAKHGVLPGRRIVAAGSGPLLIALAHNLMRAGARIVALVSMIPAGAPFRAAVPLATALGGYKALQGAFVAARLATRRVPVLHGTVVASAQGKGRVREVTVVRIDGAGRRVSGTERTLRADAAAVSYGLMPNADLFRLCGCPESFDAVRGYWRPLRNAELETRAPGVFAAGDGALVKGYAAAAEEGRRAGGAVAAQLGFQVPAETGRPGRRRLEKDRRLGRILDELSLPVSGLFSEIPDETVICRCEEVTLGDLRRAAADGAVDVDDLKRRTRIGMGSCQGRFCGQVANEVLWRLTGKVRERERFTSRIPARPVTLDHLI